MTSVGHAIAKWLPISLGVLFAAFLGIFALDSESVVGFAMHMIPSMVILVGVLVGWRRPLVGGVLFLAMAIAATLQFNTYRHLFTILFITGPFVLVGILFLLHWLLSRRAGKGTSRNALTG